MTGRNDDAHLLGAEKDVVVARPLAERKRDEAEIDLSAGDGLLLEVDAHLNRNNLKVGTVLVKFRVDACEHPKSASRCQTDRELSFLDV